MNVATLSIYYLWHPTSRSSQSQPQQAQALVTQPKSFAIGNRTRSRTTDRSQVDVADQYSQRRKCHEEDLSSLDCIANTKHPHQC